ncbi:MAG: hypothetical protein AAB365_00615 [Patescibacteria group bacterium]
MITLFTIPKPFTDPHIRLIQRNALQSWKHIHPDVEIIALGTDAGIAETAQELGLTHIPGVAITDQGTPRLDSAFALARNTARHSILMYANADMILTSDFIPAIKKADAASASPFLLCGRRWDLDITEEIDFKDTNWERPLKDRAHKEGALHSVAAMDYFIFRKEIFTDMPALVVGRIGWDNWMIWYCRKNNISSIDITPVVTAIHQNHPYRPGHERHERKSQPEALQNLSFIVGKMDTLTIDGTAFKMHADYSIKKNFRPGWSGFKSFIRTVIGI